MAADRLAALAAWRRCRLQWLCAGAVLGILAVAIGRSQAHPTGVAAVLLGSAPNFLAALALPGAHYREKKIGLVMFTVDSESQLGRRRIPNEEICEAAQKNSDMMVAFASIDPHKGKMGAREARRLVESHGAKGFKFHPTVQGFLPYDRMAWPLYEVIAEYKLPAIFHSGHSGIGSGMRCGGGLRLQNSNPMLLEDVAIDFPDMQIVVAHPSWP